jgi:hypothetical protein
MAIDDPFVAYKYNANRDEVFARLGKGWHPVPNIFAILNEDEEKAGADPDDESRRVPASFHKFLHILWREICFDRGPDKVWWTADFYMDQFNMRPSDAAKWTVAMEVSRVFTVSKVPGPHSPAGPGYGGIKSRGPLSVFHYNTKATAEDWKLFYKALRAACPQCPRPFKVHEWRAIVRRCVEANHAGVTG